MLFSWMKVREVNGVFLDKGKRKAVVVWQGRKRKRW